MNPSIPDKLYFKIGEVAKMADVQSHVLRYWESEFAVIKPKRTSSGQRLYKREDVEYILKIKLLLHEQGYTISGAKKLLQEEEISAPAVTKGKPVGATRLLHQIKKSLQEIQTIVSSS